jgi:hypothetical protein
MSRFFISRSRSQQKITGVTIGMHASLEGRFLVSNQFCGQGEDRG